MIHYMIIDHRDNTFEVVDIYETDMQPGEIIETEYLTIICFHEGYRP